MGDVFLEDRAVADADFGIGNVFAGIVPQAQVIAQGERLFVGFGDGLVDDVAAEAADEIGDAQALLLGGGAADFPDERVLIRRIAGVQDDDIVRGE